MKGTFSNSVEFGTVEFLIFSVWSSNEALRNCRSYRKIFLRQPDQQVARKDVNLESISIVNECQFSSLMFSI